MAAHDRQVLRYRLDFGAGERDVVSLLEPDWVFQYGLRPEAILAVVRDGADPVEFAPADVRENGPFLRLLSRVIFENIADSHSVRREAEIQGSGYAYLLDARTPATRRPSSRGGHHRRRPGRWRRAGGRVLSAQPEASTVHGHRMVSPTGRPRGGTATPPPRPNH